MELKKLLPGSITIIFLFLLAAVGGTLFLSGFLVGGNYAVTLEKAYGVFFKSNFLRIMGNTLLIGFVCAIISLIVGFTYAYLVERTNVPCKRILRILPFFALSIPLIGKGMGWIGMFGTNGVLNKIAISIIGCPILDVFTVWGIFLALGFGGSALVYLILAPAIRNLPSDLEDASRISGRGMVGTLTRVVMPVLAPAIISAGILMFIAAIGNFDYVFLLGAKGAPFTETLATKVYDSIYGGAIADFGETAIMSMVYIAVSFIAMTYYLKATRKTKKFEIVGGKGSRAQIHDIGPWKYLASGILILIIIGMLGIPLVGLIATALAPSTGRILEAFTLSNFAEVLSFPRFWGVMLNTFIVSIVAAVAVAFFGFFIAYAGLKSGGSFLRKLSDYASAIPLGFPPIAYGVAIFWFVLFFPGANVMYGTLIPIIMALTFIRLPHGVRMMSSSLIQVSDEMEDSARVCGSDWKSTFVKISIPLTLGGVIHAFLYTFVDSMRELGAIVLLITPTASVFTAYILQLYTNSAMYLPVVAAGATILSLIVLSFTIIMIAVFGVRRG